MEAIIGLIVLCIIIVCCLPSSDSKKLSPDDCIGHEWAEKEEEPYMYKCNKCGQECPKFQQVKFQSRIK